jgi:hypothetical protein
MARTFYARDCTVFLEDDGKIRIHSSLILNGSLATYKPKHAMDVLGGIKALGDEIPIGVMTELEKLC